MRESRWSLARSSLLPTVLAASLLSACATTSQTPAAGDFETRFAQTVAEALALSKNARADESILLMEKATLSYPTRPEPFVQLAKLRFEAGQYGAAISAADEALKKAPQDTTAMSVRAVAGLRIATESLEGLRGNESVFGTARPDATRLANTLREVLGEDVLVPPVMALAKQTRRRVSGDTTRAGVRTQLQSGDTRSNPQARRIPSSSAVDGDPFSVLRR